jgi:hypothetical protein
MLGVVAAIAPPASANVCRAPRDRPAARDEARRLVAQIRAELAPVEDQIRHAPFLATVDAHQASLAQVTAVVAEEYSIVHSDIHSFTQMKAQWDAPHGSQLFGELADGEAAALPLVIAFAASVGLDERALAAYEPRPGAQAYPSRVAWIAANADRAAAAASFLVNFAVFGDNMGRMRDALIRAYGFTTDEVAFFTFFAEPIPNFERDAIEVIATGLLDGACPIDVRRSARLLQAYELEFWQAAAEPPGSPLPVTAPH